MNALPRDDSPPPGMGVPQSVELEMSVLGGVMLEPRDAYPLAAEILRPEHFYLAGHGLIFRVMGELHGRGIPPDATSILDEMRARDLMDKIGGSGVLMGMLNSVPTGASVEYHARKVFDKAQARALITTCQRTIGDLCSQDEPNDVVLFRHTAAVEQIADRGVQVDEITTATNLAARYVDSLIEHHGNGAELVGTGITRLDQLIGGYQEGDLIVWAARTNIGKTRLMIASCAHCVASGWPVGFVSMDMGWKRLSRYLITSLNAIGGRPVDIARFDDPAWWNRQIDDATRDLLIGELASFTTAAPLYVVPEPATQVQRLFGYARKLKRLGCKVMVIDQAQNIAEYDPEDRGKLAQVVSSAKAIARKFELCVVLIHQINRQGIDMPQLQHLKDTGCFEEYSDTVVLLHDIESALVAQYGGFHEVGRDLRGATPKDWDDPDIFIHEQPRNPRPVLVNIAKNRNGERGTGEVKFDYNHGIFV